MGKLSQPREGSLLKNQPNGIPLFFDGRSPRIVTADPWAFFRNTAAEHLGQQEQARANAYINQAYDFFRAAENPQIGSKPLLYYYCFLNLAKVLPLVWGVELPLRLMHGIEDPKANIKQRIRVTGQEIRFKPRTSITDVLAQVPSVHRTFTTVSKNRTRLMPISRIEALKDGFRKRQDFQSTLQQVASPRDARGASRPRSPRLRSRGYR